MPRAKPPQWSPWTWRWVSVIESLGPEYASRLTRARSYARNGHVWRLEVRPGVLSAQVLGSYGYYTTTARIPVLSNAVWERVIERLVDSPLLLASLLAGELSPDLALLFEEAGASLYPESIEQITWRCTCPDWEEPCKHELALCYALADQMDRDPALLLALRGKSIEEITTAAQRRWASHESAERAAEGDAESADEAASALDLANFYQAGPALEEFSATTRAPNDAAALLYSIGKPAFAGENEDLLTPLVHLYEVMTEQALGALDRVRRTDENRRKR